MNSMDNETERKKQENLTKILDTLLFLYEIFDMFQKNKKANYKELLKKAVNMIEEITEDEDVFSENREIDYFELLMLRESLKSKNPSKETPFS